MKQKEEEEDPIRRDACFSPRPPEQKGHQNDVQQENIFNARSFPNVFSVSQFRPSLKAQCESKFGRSCRAIHEKREKKKQEERETGMGGMRGFGSEKQGKDSRQHQWEADRLSWNRY